MFLRATKTNIYFDWLVNYFKNGGQMFVLNSELPASVFEDIYKRINAKESDKKDILS